MRKHLNDYVFNPLLYLLILIIIVLLALVLIFITPYGVKTIAYVADTSLEKLNVKGVSGSLLTGLHIDDVSWADGTGISLSDVDLKLQYYNTRRGRLVAETVRAGRLVINLPESKAGSKVDTTSLPNFGLPLNMNIHSFQLDSLQITQDVKDDPGSRTLVFQVRDIELKKVTISDGKLRFRRLLGKPIIIDEPLNINVTEGRLNMDQPHDIKTGGGITFKHPKLGDIDGNIELAGTLTNYNFKGEINHQQEKLGLQTIKFLGQGDYKRVHLEQVKLEGEHGVVEAKGRVIWNPEKRWAFKVDGKDLSTKKFLPDWPATINADLRYSGSYNYKRLENHINILSIEGNVREYDLKLKGQVTEKAGVIITDDLDLQLGDNQLQVTGKASEPFNLKWSIDAKNFKQMLPKQMANLQVAGSLKGSGTLKGEIKTPEISVNLVADGLVYENFKQGKESLILDGELVLDKGALQLKDLILKSGVNSLKASGQASEPFNLKWDIDANSLKQVSPLLAGKIKGNGVLKGSIKKPEVKVKLAANGLIYNEIKQGKETLFLEGDLGVNRTDNKDVIQLKDLTLKSGTNSLQVSGQASEPLKLKVKIKAQNLAEISPDINGRAQGMVEVLGSYKSPIIKTNINATGLRYKETSLSESEIRVQGEMQLVEGAPIIKNLSMNIGNNKLQVSGRAMSPFSLNWNIDGKNLNQLMPGLSGFLLAKGQLQGSIDKPIVNATVDAKNINYKDFKLGSANVKAKTNNGIYNIKADFKKLQSAGQTISKAGFDLNGRIDKHSITASVDHDEAKVKLKANGSWINQNWKGVLQSLQIKETQAGNWRLQQPTSISLSQKAFSSGKLCLSGSVSKKKTQVCSTTSWSTTSGLSSKGTLSKTPLALAKPWLPEGIDLDGSVNGSYDIKQNNGKPKGTIKVALPDSSFSIKGEDGEEKTFAYKNAKITAAINDKKIKAKASLNIVNRGKLVADATIKLSPQNGKHTINGTAKFDVPNINWAQEFIPRSRGLRGKMSSKINFSGLLSKPQIKGKVDITNAYLRLPEAGTELTNINIKIRADKPGKAVISGKMLMGKGVLNVSGNLDARDLAKWKATINIKGKNILFMNTNEIRARITPDVKIGITPKIISFKGKILIPEANIKLKKIPETSIDENSDAFIVGERKPGEEVSAIKIQPNLLIELGDKIRIDAFGLNAKLTGSVKVTHNRRNIITNGSLRVSEGKYQAYGQDLAIDNGRLIFKGSPKHIGMDIRATRKIDSTVVGIHLGGSLLSPKSSIFSDPTMPESEALSFLLTGHSLSTSSGAESALLMSAVRGLGVTGDNSLIHNIGSSLGLDDVNIVGGQDLNKSKLQLGKQLGSKLYIRYLVGLFDQTQKISIAYKINKVLSLEAQTSSDNSYGLDFIYEIERD